MVSARAAQPGVGTGARSPVATSARARSKRALTDSTWAAPVPEGIAGPASRGPRDRPIGNASKEDLEWNASAATVDILDENDVSKIITTVPKGTVLRFLASGTLNGTTFHLMETNGASPSRGIVDATEVKERDAGRDTIKLAVPGRLHPECRERHPAEGNQSPGARRCRQHNRLSRRRYRQAAQVAHR